MPQVLGGRLLFAFGQASSVLPMRRYLLGWCPIKVELGTKVLCERMITKKEDPLVNCRNKGTTQKSKKTKSDRYSMS
jgi:hypothetical protein